MVVDTIKENLCVNKLVATKKEVILVEGDMIVPDSKPDILSTICTSGVVCIYKKEVLDDKVRIDGNINTYIMYMADDSQDKVRGLTTNLDFSENIMISNCKEGMDCKIDTKLKSIEAKVINGRKVGIKAAIEIDIKIYEKDDIEIINDIQNAEEIQMLKEDLRVNSLVGTGSSKIYAKETINIENTDNLAEILKANICICDKDIKISYNKILTKSEAEIKIMYLTEDNRIGNISAKIPVVGFIDIPNVTEENLCDVNYEIRNIILKPNSSEEHSIYVEIEIEVMAIVYEEKQINLIQDLYNPFENLEFNKKKITTITNKRTTKEIKQIREKFMLEGIENRSIIDVDVMPFIQNENIVNNKVNYEGEIELRVILSNSDLQIETRDAKIPFEYELDNIGDSDNISSNMEIEVMNQDFVVQEGGMVTANIDLIMNADSYQNTNINMIDEIQTNGEREAQDYSIIMYIVKKDDTLWKIAKQFGSTIEDIVRTNGIEDENNINVGQKLFIPYYSKTSMKSYV